MAILSILKSILPYLLDYFKEAFNPKEMAAKTTILERFLILFVLALVVFGAFVTEKVFILHDKRVQLEKEKAELVTQIGSLKVEMKTIPIPKNITTPPKINCIPTYHAPPIVPKKTVSVVPTVENHAVVRQRFIDAINEE